jgi:hypothetical protein
MRKIMTTLLTTAALAVSTLAGQAGASPHPLPERVKAPAGATTAAEALKQVTAAAKAGKGKTTASGVTVNDSSAFLLHVRAYDSRYCLDNFASGGGANNSSVGSW